MTYSHKHTPLVQKGRQALALVLALGIGGTAIAYGASAAALTLSIDQVKISGLLLNTQNDPSVPSTIGKGNYTILAYADTVNTTNSFVLSTSTTSAVPTAITNMTVVDGTNTIAVKSDTPLNGVASIGGRYRVRFTLSGSGQPVFNAAADASQFALLGQATGNICQITAAPVATNTTINPDPAVAEFSFIIAPGCSAAMGADQGPTFLVLDAPWRNRQVGDTFVSVALEQDGLGAGTYSSIASPASRQLAQAVNPVDASLVDAPSVTQQISQKLPTLFAFTDPPAAPYIAISTATGTDAAIGSVKAGLRVLAPNNAGPLGAGQTPTVFTNLGNATFTPIKASDISTELTITASSGKWNGIVPAVQGTTATFPTTNSVKLSTNVAIPQQTNINLAISTDSGQTLTSTYIPQSYTATLQVKINPSLGQNNPSPITNVPLETAYQEGLTFRIPWFGGATSSNPGQLRIVNSNTTVPTGPVYLVAKASVPAQAASNGCLLKQSLAPTEELLVSPDQLTQCPGPFKRADLILAIRAAAPDVIVKFRIQSLGNKLAEVSISPNTASPSSYEFPWFGGSKASTPSTIRLSNVNDVSTGAVSLTLSNIIEGVQSGTLTCNASTVSELGSILPQGELLISTSLADRCFGAFKRGDLSATIAGSTAGVTARMRVTSGSGAAAAEQQLGNLPADQRVNASTNSNVLIRAGWVGGNLAATPSIIRLSNAATVPTGKITLTLENVVDGTGAGPLVCDGTKLTDLWTLFPKAEIVLDTAKLTTCFGNFRRGDLAISVGGPASGLTGKMRMVSTSTGIVSEQALGEKCVTSSTSTASGCLIAAWYDGPKSYSKSVLRISNAGSVETGPVQIILRNATESSLQGPQTCSSLVLPALNAIPAQGELVFDSVAAKTCFGDFRRGDLFISVSGLTSGLYPSMRLVSADGAMVADQALGIQVTGASPNP